MARHVGKHGARHSLWGGVAVFVVIALTGFLLSTNVRVNRTVAATNDTADLVEQGVDEANQLQQDVSDLTKQVAQGRWHRWHRQHTEPRQGLQQCGFQPDAARAQRQRRNGNAG